MKPELILRSDLLDLLFENRNKAYGAYVLRREYNKRLRASLGLMLLFCLLMTFLFSWKRTPPPAVNGFFPVVDTIVLRPYNDHVIPPPPPPPPPTGRSSMAATTASNVPVIVSETDSTEAPDQDLLETTRIGDLTRAGDGDMGIQPTLGDAGGEEAPAPPAPPAPAPEEPLRTASVMPVFPGGEEALKRWLFRNLQPQEDMEAGQQVRVVVRFVVGKTGQIDRIELVQQGGESYDNEVVRVVKKMPDWQPGKQDGRPVAVWFTLPVIFAAGD